MAINISDANCPIRKTMQLIGGKWTMAIIFQISDRTVRYGELKRAIPGISEKMLIEQLKFLCEKGLVSKKSYPQVPPRVEYTITPLGKKIFPVINEIAKFGIENL